MVTGNEAGTPGCLWRGKGPSLPYKQLCLRETLYAFQSLSFAICQMGVINVADLRGMNNCY